MEDTWESKDSNTISSSFSSWMVSNSSLPAVAKAEALAGSSSFFCSELLTSASAIEELKSSNGDFGRDGATSGASKGLVEVFGIGFSTLGSTVGDNRSA